MCTGYEIYTDNIRYDMYSGDNIQGYIVLLINYDGPSGLNICYKKGQMQASTMWTQHFDGLATFGFPSHVTYTFVYPAK